MSQPSTVDILHVPVSRITLDAAVATIGRWLDEGSSRYVCACDVHSLMRARTDATHMAALRDADMVTPDGQPVVWTAWLRGVDDIARVCGPDLMPRVCHALHYKSRHYFFGGAPGVAEALASRLQAEQPKLRVVGTESPPYRAWTPAEQQATLERIRASGANIVWVGLGCPKQEAWMLANRAALPGVIMLGVGAAFDFHTDRVKRAPAWMRARGLEWLHRLVSEPQRLWRRYLLLAPQFVVRSGIETIALRWRARFG